MEGRGQARIASECWGMSGVRPSSTRMDLILPSWLPCRRSSEFNPGAAVPVADASHPERGRVRDRDDSWSANDDIAALDIATLIVQREQVSFAGEPLDRALALRGSDRAFAAPVVDDFGVGRSLARPPCRNIDALLQRCGTCHEA